MAIFTLKHLFHPGLKLVTTVLFYIFPALLFAQQETWLVYFTDKENSPYSIYSPEAFLSQRSVERRIKYSIPLDQTDLPVNPQYLDSIKSTGALVTYYSKWLNAAIITGSPDQLSASAAFSFVYQSDAFKKSTENVKTDPSPLKVSADYGMSASQYQMLEMIDMHNEGYRGEGKMISVFDAGFQNVHTISAFDSLRNGRLIGTYDFPDNEENVFDNHDHGTKVLSVLAAYKEGAIIGGAWKAEYLLFRTENVSFEKEIEEVYWLLAAERADSAGTDIIHSSVGYNTFPDDPSASHTYSELDGNTAIITRAADLAAAKGILVINSAGNEGSSSWKYILFPADGNHVLTVGGVTSSESAVASSSEGPTADGRIKPDVVAQGMSVVVVSGSGTVTTSSGTSFAAPIVTGLAAGLWQRFPSLSNIQIMQLIRESADQFYSPDNKKGFGVPSYLKAVLLLSIKNSLQHNHIRVFPNPSSDIADVVFPFEHHGPVHFSLNDPAGRSIREEERVMSGSSLQIDISDLSTGHYFARIVAEKVEWNFILMKVP